MIERFIKSKNFFYLPIVTYPSHLVLHQTFSENGQKYLYKGNYIDFISENNDCNNVDFLIFNVLALNQKIKIDIATVLEFENLIITNYTLITEEMALDMFMDSDINITNNINCNNYIDTETYVVLSDSDNASSVSLNSVSSSNSISDLVSHKIKMNSGLENISNKYCYFNSAIHMFIHDINIRNALKSFDENYSIIDKEEPELIKYQLMDYFKQLIIITEFKNDNNNINNTKSDLINKLRQLFISKFTTRFIINEQEDSNEVYNVILSFFKTNSDLIPNNLLIDALKLYGSNVCNMKSLICKEVNCNGLNNHYIKSTVINNILNEIRIEQPENEILEENIDHKLSLPLALNYYQTSTTEIVSELNYAEPCIDCFVKSAVFNHQKRIVEYPQILTISLQRFAFENQNYIDPFMHFPLQVKLKDLQLNDGDTLSNFEKYLVQFDNESVYYLSKFVQHRGNSIESGHYHAYVLDPSCNLWYCYNDNEVTLMKPEEIEKEIAINILNGDYHKGIQYAFYEKDIIERIITSEGILQ